MAEVSIIMGSESDLPIMREALDALSALGVPCELKVISAHRTPRRAFEYAAAAKGRGVKVIIAGAGGAAHLAGVVAALTTLPVIGVPIKSAALNGVDSLYSTAQMPSGVPVATMAINGAKNAGLFAARILAVNDAALSRRLDELAAQMEASVNAQSERVENSL